jgi:hypothetical protein
MKYKKFSKKQHKKTKSQKFRQRKQSKKKKIFRKTRRILYGGTDEKKRKIDTNTNYDDEHDKKIAKVEGDPEDNRDKIEEDPEDNREFYDLYITEVIGEDIANFNEGNLKINNIIMHDQNLLEHNYFKENPDEKNFREDSEKEVINKYRQFYLNFLKDKRNSFDKKLNAINIFNTNLIKLTKYRPNLESENEKEKRVLAENIARMENTINTKNTTSYYHPQNYRQSHWGNTGKLLSFGVGNETIKEFFDNFSFINLDKNNLKRIGGASANGFVIQLPFLKDNFRVYTALKCSRSQTADNLFYEYLVGKCFVNKQNKIFPCFLETYQAFKFKINNNNNNDPYLQNGYYDYLYNCVQSNDFKSVDFINVPLLEPFYDINESDLTKIAHVKNLKESCKLNKYICVNVQHFDQFISLSDSLKNCVRHTDNTIIDFTLSDVLLDLELYNILFQLYFPLWKLQNVYTHYDLHCSNVFLYKPYTGKNYIKMEYYGSDGKMILDFKTEYIVKIIDYGRNYFFVNDELNTQNIFKEQICKFPECNPKQDPTSECGKLQGYSMIKQSTTKNVSQDLRAAENIFDKFDIFQNYEIPHFKTNYWNAEEIIDSSYSKFLINNIADLIKLLARGIKFSSNFKDKLTELKSQFGNNISKLEDIKYDNTWTHAATIKVFGGNRHYVFYEEKNNLPMYSMQLQNKPYSYDLNIQHSVQKLQKIQNKEQLRLLIQILSEVNKYLDPNNQIYQLINDEKTNAAINSLNLTNIQKKSLEPFFGKHMSDWDLEKITDLSNLFDGCHKKFITNFNCDVGKWDVSNVNNFEKTFYNCEKFNRNLVKWKIKKTAFSFESMFENCNSFNGLMFPMVLENDYIVTLGNMFKGCRNFNQKINWYLHAKNGTNLSGLFDSCISFNSEIQNISSWRTKILNIDKMFKNCEKFNQIIILNTEYVKSMKETFLNCKEFDKPLNRWKMMNVIDATQMFKGCSKFNQNISNWQINKLVNLDEMFADCVSFNQNLSSWGIFLKKNNITRLPESTFRNCRKLQENFKPKFN